MPLFRQNSEVLIMYQTVLVIPYRCYPNYCSHRFSFVLLVHQLHAAQSRHSLHEAHILVVLDVRLKQEVLTKGESLY